MTRNWENIVLMMMMAMGSIWGIASSAGLAVGHQPQMVYRSLQMQDMSEPI